MNDEIQAQREPTYGEKAVGLTFNPSGDVKVQEIKELYAKIIDVLVNTNNAGIETDSDYEERISLFTEAIRQSQTAQMWSVKAITWK